MLLWCFGVLFIMDANYYGASMVFWGVISQFEEFCTL